MSEVELARAAVKTGDTIFGKIIRKEIPSEFLYEDDKSIIIKDVAPQAPTHLLIIPKKPILSIQDASDEDTEILGHLLQVGKNYAKKINLNNGYRLVINNGVEGCQSVYHLHVHLLGGKQLSWPPGC